MMRLGIGPFIESRLKSSIRLLGMEPFLQSLCIFDAILRVSEWKDQ